MVDRCVSYPCHNNGTCTSSKDGYECKCSPEFHGVNCEMSKLYIEDITRWRGDMNLFSSGKTIFYERAQRVSKILFLPRENKIHIFKPPCNVLFII